MDFGSMILDAICDRAYQVGYKEGCASENSVSKKMLRQAFHKGFQNGFVKGQYAMSNDMTTALESASTVTKVVFDGFSKIYNDEEDVEIKKRLGFILELDIKEKKVLYVTRSTNKYKLSTFEDIENNNEYDVPMLINFVPEDIEKEFTEKLSEVETNILSLISEIEYSTTDYDDERFILYMNDGNQVYVTNNRVEVLNKYIDIMKKISSDKKGILYLDNGNYFKIIEQ